MKKIMIIALTIASVSVSFGQRRTVVVPAPQPPNVPLDGGVSLLLLAGGALAIKNKETIKQ